MVRCNAYFVLALLGAGCSGSGDREITRNLDHADAAARAAQEDADAPDDTAQEPDDAATSSNEPDDAAGSTDELDAGAASAEGSNDASAAALDAGSAAEASANAALDGASASNEASLQVDSGQADAANSDAGTTEPGTFRLQFDIYNPHAHQNPIAFIWGDAGSAQPDDEGFVYADQAADRLDVVLGESDETQVFTYYGIANGDKLSFLYRNFREPTGFLNVLVPADPPGGATIYGVSGPAGSTQLSNGRTSASLQYYSSGASAYLAQALVQAGQDQSVVGFAFATHVAGSIPAHDVTLGSWVAPRQVSIVLANGDGETLPGLRMHADDGWFYAGHTAGQASFAVAPGFADLLEAQILTTHYDSDDNESVTRRVSRCGPEADSFALDLADALAVPSAVPEDHGDTVTWNFDVPAVGQGGDVLVFDGIIMPPTQASVTLPNTHGSQHDIMRIDFASVPDYAAFKRTIRFDLSATFSSDWCQGTDYVRLTHVTF